LERPGYQVEELKPLKRPHVSVRRKTGGTVGETIEAVRSMSVGAKKTTRELLPTFNATRCLLFFLFSIDPF